MSQDDTIKSASQSSVMERGEVRQSIPSSPPTDVPRSPTSPRPPPQGRLKQIVQGENFRKLIADTKQQSRQPEQQWSQAIEHVLDYLREKSAGEKKDRSNWGPLSQEDDPHDPPKKSADEDPNLDEPGVLPGYPLVADFMGHDPSLFMCRAFSTLQIRLLLEQQEGLREIQESLEELDRRDYAKDHIKNDPMFGTRMFTRRRLNDEELNERKHIFDEAQSRFHDYVNLVSNIRTLQCLERPSGREYKTLRDFLFQFSGLRPSELYWIFQKEEVVSLRCRTAPRKTGVLAILSGLATPLKFAWMFFKTFFDESNRQNRQWQQQTLLEDVRSFLAMTFTVVLIEVMFAVPIYTLSIAEHGVGTSIGILVAFAFGFAIILASAGARTYETLSGSAAYLAVLVVFFGSASQPSSGRS